MKELLVILLEHNNDKVITRAIMNRLGQLFLLALVCKEAEQCQMKKQREVRRKQRERSRKFN